MNKECKRPGPDIITDQGEACKGFNTFQGLQEKASKWREWQTKEPETTVLCVDTTEVRMEVEMQIEHSRVKVVKSVNEYDGWREKDHLFFSYTEAAALHAALSRLLYGDK